MIEAGASMDDWFLKYAVEYDLDEIAEILKSNGAAL